MVDNKSERETARYFGIHCVFHAIVTDDFAEA